MAAITPETFLAQLEARKIMLFINNLGCLAYRAPKGVVTDKVAQAIRNHSDLLKPILIERDPDAKLLWLARECEAAMDEVYAETIREMYRAALNGELPDVIPLRPGHKTCTRRWVILTVADLRKEREIHGDNWQNISDNNERARDLETAAFWWRAQKAVMGGVEDVEKC